MFKQQTIRFSTLFLLFLSICGPAPAQPAANSEDGHVLLVGTKEAPPFAMKASDGTWRGIGIDLWRRVADRLHLQYQLTEMPLDRLIENTGNGSLDAAVAAITVTAEREKVLDFTQPFYATGLGIAVPRNAAFNWWRLLSSLLSIDFTEALLGVVGATLGVGAVVWLLERRHTAHFGGGRKGLVSSIWWSALTMTQAGAEQEPLTASGRFVAVAWMAASVIVIAVFTAGITSELTAKQLQGIVHGVDDLRWVRVGAVAGTASLDYLTEYRIPYRTYPTAGDALLALKNGALDAVVYDRPLLSWLARQEFGGWVEVLDVTFAPQSYAIALPDNSPLRMGINQVMLDQLQSEWWHDTVQRYLGK